MPCRFESSKVYVFSMVNRPGGYRLCPFLLPDFKAFRAAGIIAPPVWKARSGNCIVAIRKNVLFDFKAPTPIINWNRSTYCRWIFETYICKPQRRPAISSSYTVIGDELLLHRIYERIEHDSDIHDLIWKLCVIYPGLICAAVDRRSHASSNTVLRRKWTQILISEL